MITKHDRSIDRREFLVASSAVAAGTWLHACASVQRRFDIVLLGATVVDGTGEKPFTADVGLAGDRIVALGRIDREQARVAIDVSGLCVAPGFIDIHSHSDRTILECPTADSRVLQGYTTEITGNCGGSAAPAKVDEKAEKQGEKQPTWTDVRSYFEAERATRISLNQALLIGQGTLRDNAIGPVDRDLTASEMTSVVRALEIALDQGAFGLSTGLEYLPGIYTKAAEIESLARIVAARGGLYASHMRFETSRVLDAIHETIDVGARTGVRVEISHLKAAGRRNWGLQDDALHAIEDARARGIDVLADAYPYTAYSTGLTILLPAWSKDGGTSALLERLRDPAQRAKIAAATGTLVDEDPGGYELIVVSSVKTAKNRALAGKSIAEIAELWKQPPLDALLRLVEEEEGSASYIGHAMSAGNVERVLAHPLVMIGSDGTSRSFARGGDEGRPHPRSYGTAPRVLGYYCRERKVFDLATAVKKLTSMPAERARIADRGRIATEMKADLVVFDAERIHDEATFEDPQRAPVGIAHVIVNGVAVVTDGKHTGARPGEVLTRS